MLKDRAGEIPLPPEHLIHLVTGSCDVSKFLEGGRLVLESLADVFSARGVGVGDFATILDFGCGCGRFLRHLRLMPCGLYGTDYNPAMIDWCRENLPYAHFERNGLEPPLGFADDMFDLACAFSVFTHLPEATQFRWIDELYRVLKPGGYLVLTTHGERYLHRLSPRELDSFRAGQVVVWNTHLAGSNDCGAFHPGEYVRRQLAKAFEHLLHLPGGFKGFELQDLYLFRKPLCHD